MKFDYWTLLNPYPIKLSIGTLRKPKLREIAYDAKSNMCFDEYSFYEYLLKLTPETYYTQLKGEEGQKYWNALLDDEKLDIELYDVVLKEKDLRNRYVDIFNFFFLEEVKFHNESVFILIDPDIKKNDEDALYADDKVLGVIHRKIFNEVLNAIQQICCIADKEENVEELKFKNNYAKKLYLKMQKAAQKERERKKVDKNFSLPNLISAVSNMHTSINPINVWELTVYQLMDAFNRLQRNAIYDIDANRVSFWGDEKKTFNPALWYKNEFDT